MIFTIWGLSNTWNKNCPKKAVSAAMWKLANLCRVCTQMTHNVPPLKGPRPHVCSTRLVLFLKITLCTHYHTDTLITASFTNYLLFDGTWPLSDNCVWLNNTSPVVAKNDTTLLFTPKPLCFNHSWDSLKKKKKSIGLHLKTSKPFNTLENQASMHSFSKMLLSRDGGEHTCLPMRPWMSVWERQPEGRE